jgi:hypothetical protein
MAVDDVVLPMLQRVVDRGGIASDVHSRVSGVEGGRARPRVAGDRHSLDPGCLCGARSRCGAEQMHVVPANGHGPGHIPGDAGQAIAVIGEE